MLSTITARLTADNDEYIASITGGMGVIDKNTGELRSTFDILKDLSKAWENLTSVEKQELTETVAGKTQRSLFTAIMSNFDTAVGATEAALNSEGSALEENNKRMDSLNGKLTQLQSAWQSLARDTINSDFVKTLLDIATGFVKITDAMGGLQTYIPIVASFFGMWKSKSITEGYGKISEAISNISPYLYNLKNLSAETGKSMISVFTQTASSLTKFNLVMLGIGATITVVKGIWNKYKEAQEEAQSSALQTLQDTDGVVKAKEDEIKKTQDEITQLENEKQAYIENTQAKGENLDESVLESKDKEIQKRRLNIEQMKIEYQQTLKQREAAARSLEPNKANYSDFKLPTSTFLKFGTYTSEAGRAIEDINSALKNASDNTGTYNKTLEGLIQRYNAVINEKEPYNMDTTLETQIIKELNERLNENKEAYEQDKEIADEFYNILLEGGNISQDNLEWLKEFLGLNDEQIQQVSQGTDVIAQNEEAKKNNTQATGDLTERQKELNSQTQQAQSTFKSLNTEIDTAQKSYSALTTAVDEYNNNGYLSIDTLQSLLSLDDEYLAMLSMQNGQLVLNTSALDQKVDSLIATKVQELEAAAATDLYNLAQGNTEKMSALAKTAIADSGDAAEKTGNKFQSAVPGIASFTGAMLQAKAAAGEASDPTQFEADANKIIDAYKNAYKSITELGATTTRAGGTSGTKHTYAGTDKKSKSGSSKKDSTKKEKEEYKAEIDTLYNYENALDNAKDEVDRLKDALSDTDSYDEQEKYINQLIAALNNQIAKTQELKNAQANQIQDYINQLRAQGFAIDYNAEKNELYINNMQHLADFSGDTAKSLEKIIKKIQDLNSNNRTLDGSIRDLTGDVKDYYDQLAEIPEKKLEKFNDLMKDFQQSQLDAVQDQIDDLNNAMKNDPRLAALEKEIEALEKENDTIDKQKEMEEKLLAVEEARQKLQNAMSQRTLLVYSAQEGWHYEVDPDKVKEAQDELKDAQDDLNDQIKSDKLDQLKEEQEAIKNSYQDQIDALEDFLDNQNYIIDKANREGIQSFDDLRKKLAEFGLDSEENLKKASDWLNQYNDALSKLNQTATNALSNSTVATNGLIYSSATQNRIDQVLTDMNIDTTMASTPVAKYDKIDQGTGGQNIYIDTIELPNVSNANEFVEALKDLPRLATTQSSSRK